MSALVLAATGSALVEQIGAYAGLGCILGLAVMALLYFSQAREVRRLREWAGREPERAAELTQRVQADPQRRVVAQPMAPTTPAAQQQQATAALYASVGATPPGAVTPAVPPAGSLARPAATPAAGLLPAPGAVPPPAAPGTPAPSPTPGLGAAVTGAAAAAASSTAAGPQPPAASPAPGAPPAQSPGLGTPASTAPTPPSPINAAAPRTAAAQRSASLSAYANGATGQDTRESAAARPELQPADEDDGGPSKGRIAAYAGGGIAAVIVAVALALVLTGGDDTQPPNDIGNAPAQAPSAASSGAGSGAGSGSPSSSRLTAAERRATQVAVLNGTTQTGLGRNVADKIEKQRFSIGGVDTNADQQIPATIVSYKAGNEAAARAVAKIVGVGTSSVQPADANSSVAADADVVVTVGLDLSG